MITLKDLLPTKVHNKYEALMKDDDDDGEPPRPSRNPRKRIAREIQEEARILAILPVAANGCQGSHRSPL